MTNPKRKSSIISLNGFLKRSATKFIHIVIAYMKVQTIGDYFSTTSYTEYYTDRGGSLTV